MSKDSSEPSNDSSVPEQETAHPESGPRDAQSPPTVGRRARRRVDPAGDDVHASTQLPQPVTAHDVESPAPATEPVVTDTAAGDHDAGEPTVAVSPQIPAGPVRTDAPHTAPTATQPAVGETVHPAKLEDSFEDEAAARAKARDRAVVGSPTLAVVLQVVLAILAPLVILIGVVRLVASPLFLWFEYHRPGFPADEYGMDTEQRLTLGSYGVDYLFNLAPEVFLANLQFANGNPVFTDGEVGHMADVKTLMFATNIFGVVAAIVCVVIIVLLFRMRKGAIARGLFSGAVWFTVAMIVVAVLAIIGWEAFFAGFHQMFFADGTWTFYTSDSLIRLYPGQFWVDAGIWVAALTLIIMVIMLVVTAPTGRRRHRNAAAQRFLESQVVGETEPTQP